MPHASQACPLNGVKVQCAEFFHWSDVFLISSPDWSYLTDNKDRMLPYPPYSLDLLLPVFHLFSHEISAQGRAYQQSGQVKDTVPNALKNILQNDFQWCFQDCIAHGKSVSLPKDYN
jgi:hypothetical protein